MTEQSAQRRFEEHISLYLNGTLHGEERAFVEQYLRQHPQAHEELLYWRELRGALAEAANDAPADIGLAKLEERMRQAAPVGATAPALSRSLWWQHVANWLRPLATPPAFAFASLLILVQAGAILSLLGTRGDGSEEAVTTRSLGERPRPAAIVSVKFAASASMDVVTKLLGALDARIIEGPIESGRYVIALRPAAKDGALAKLKASGIAQDLIVLPAPEPKQ
jgi:anti-sigma factor RsiW